MKSINYPKYGLLLIIIGLLCSVGCRKKEYQVPEQGEKIPYTDSVTTSLSQLVHQTSEPLFALLWERAEVDAMIGELDFGRGNFTLLRPSDAALTAAGWTSQQIQAADKAPLLDFIKAHLIGEAISADAIQRKAGNLKVESMYAYSDLAYTINLFPLQALLSLNWLEGEFLVNGKSVGNQRPLQAKNGFIYDINTVITPPSRTAWQEIVANPDFSLYVGILEATDAKYREIFKEANGYYPEEGSEIEGLYNRASRMDYTMDIYHDLSGNPFVWDLNTYFIPRNEAFHDAGFHSVQDLMDFNERRGLPKAIWEEATWQYPGYYGIEGEFATDSLLDFHHNWGFRFVTDYTHRRENNIFLFHDDLQSPAVRNLTIGSYTIPVFSGSMLVRTETSNYPMPFLFEGNQMQIKGTTDRSTIVSGDIVTLNGVVHAVDKLLLPSDFNIHN